MSEDQNMKSNDLQDNFKGEYEQNEYRKKPKHQSEFFEDRYAPDAQNITPYTREFTEYNEVESYNMPNYRASCPSHQEMQQAGQYDIENLKSMWKRERNRLAAKKSRDKKAILMKQLVIKERALEDDMNVLKNVVCQYDNILKEMLYFLDNMIGCDKREATVMLFDCLCRLKKSDGSFLTEVSGIINQDLYITNDKLEDLTTRIRSFLNELLYKYNN
ncbi:hypothetical protein COBT_003368 [Conglomerata obtusa]